MTKRIMSIIALSITMTTTGCSTLLSTPDLSGPDFTNQQAVALMEDTIKAHAALDNTTPGALKTVCNYDDTIDDPETYRCTSLVKESMVVLYADCTPEMCKATGYDKVEKDDE